MDEAQRCLIESNQIELLDWVLGAQPSFDNVAFSDSDDFGELLPVDLERGSQIQESSLIAQDYYSHVTSGSRANLLFVESSLAMIKDNQELIDNPQASTAEQKNILRYQNAVVAL